ncbi:hypothetical protein Cni_G24538 [Canna indica]|uniref:Uncharacterized protein n=1 Tax=Canna indica TaxID=4628 RepID=A0AAQ3KY92_9LILI|nr:hypothetical protein Cni_G24538 [Canna indica]
MGDAVEVSKASQVGSGAAASTEGVWLAEGGSSGKSAWYPYSAMVAHRALFGAHRRPAGGGGGGRKVGGGDGKSTPSRLSRVSAAEDGA